MNESLRVVVVGTGYVGLVTGACLADLGHYVTCIDVNKHRIARLEKGEIPIFEPGLEQLVNANVSQGRLRFSSDLAQSAPGAGCFFIAVGTPPMAGDGSADLSFLFAAAKEIADVLPPGGQCTVAIKSTVLVGTGDRVEKMMRLRRPDLDLHVLSNPEFLREGSAISDFMHPDRIVIGGADENAIVRLKQLYGRMEDDGACVMITSRASAELIKYASNAFLATKIAFINEIADLCEQVGADIGDVSRGIGSDRRIGMSFLNPGPGYGGSCFPKDTLALTKAAQEAGVVLSIVNQTIASNNVRKLNMAAKVVNALDGNVVGKRIAIFGLAFKANTDDVRDSPAITIIQSLQKLGAHIRACDPKGIAQARQIIGNIDYFLDPLKCAEHCDAVVVVTEWDCFRTIDLTQLRLTMRGSHLIDLRRIIDRERAEKAGFSLVTLGLRQKNNHKGPLIAGLNMRSKSRGASGKFAKISRVSAHLEKGVNSEPAWTVIGENPVEFTRGADWSESQQIN